MIFVYLMVVHTHFHTFFLKFWPKTSRPLYGIEQYSRTPRVGSQKYAAIIYIES
jgi:hypothetical protein